MWQLTNLRQENWQKLISSINLCSTLRMCPASSSAQLHWHWCWITWPCEHLVIGEIIVVGVSGHKLIYHGTYLHLRDLEIKYIISPIYLKSRKAIKIMIHKLFVTAKCWKKILDSIIIRWSLIKKWSNNKLHNIKFKILDSACFNRRA